LGHEHVREAAMKTPVPVRLRQATARDSEFAYEVRKTALGEYVRQVRGWDEDEQRRLHRRRFASQVFQVIVAAGTDVGILALSYEPDCLRVNQLLVSPEHQGKGIGTACMTRVLEDAAGRGMPVRLQVLEVNHRAIEFYRRLGFINAGEDDTHIQMDKPARRLGQGTA
jgi:ribosomal protein S18 acetylase RimI-like enzyme